MALPSITDHSFKGPTSFVVPALDAFLATSKEFRELNEAAERSNERNQNAFLKSVENQRRQEKHKQDSMIDYERHGVFMDEAVFERNVIRPLKVEAARNRIKSQRFALKSAREADLAKAAELDALEKSKEQFSALLSGGIQSESATFETVSEGEKGKGRAGQGVEKNTVYWDHESGRAVLATEGADGGTELIDRDGNILSREPGTRATLTRMKSVDKVDNSRELLDGVSSPGSLEDIREDERIRAASSLLQFTEARYKDDRRKSVVQDLATRRLILESDPRYQLLKAKGDLDPPAIRKFKDGQAENTARSLLRLNFRSDAKAREFMEANPGIVGDLKQMDTNTMARVVGDIVEREEDKNALSVDQKTLEKKQRELNVKMRVRQEYNRQGREDSTEAERLDDEITELRSEISEINEPGGAFGGGGGSSVRKQRMSSFFKRLNRGDK